MSVHRRSSTCKQIIVHLLEIKKLQTLQWVDRLGRYLFGVIFIAAAVPKLLDVDEFRGIIGAYGLLPDILLLPSAILIPILEILLGFGVIVNRPREKIGSLLLLLLFISVLSYALYMGLDIDCGCFGPEDPEHFAFQGLRVALGRDLIMCFILLYSIWFSSNRNYSYQSIAGVRNE